jgi:undecaprenyl diphosphate synthase
MDGNGRYAKKKGKNRSFGHLQGGYNLFKIAEFASKIGINELSVFAFSSENWKRSEEEVNFLMKTPLEYYNKYKDRIKELSYQVKFIGRRDRLSSELVDMFINIEKETLGLGTMTLNILVDYGSIDEVIRVFNNHDIKTEDDLFNNLWVSKLDIVIRTGKETRLSNFLLLQSVYAEIYFSKKYWPLFSKRDFKKIINNFENKNRRFGGL